MTKNEETRKAIQKANQILQGVGLYVSKTRKFEAENKPYSGQYNATIKIVEKHLNKINLEVGDKVILLLETLEKKPTGWSVEVFKTTSANENPERVPLSFLSLPFNTRKGINLRKEMERKRERILKHKNTPYDNQYNAKVKTTAFGKLQGTGLRAGEEVILLLETMAKDEVGWTIGVMKKIPTETPSCIPLNLLKIPRKTMGEIKGRLKLLA